MNRSYLLGTVQSVFCNFFSQFSCGIPESHLISPLQVTVIFAPLTPAVPAHPAIGPGNGVVRATVRAAFAGNRVAGDDLSDFHHVILLLRVDVVQGRSRKALRQ